MRISVVINTFNRAESLRHTLDALRHQTYTDFEVVVVDGPSEDGTQALLAERAGELRVVRFEERNLSMSRNLGIDAAAGEVVAFIDDDAVPEARWLEDLAAAYDGPEVGGAGGLTLDNSGTRIQYRYSVCDRIGRTDFDRQPPFDVFNRPGADPYLYLQGTNASFRRSALEAVEGFDEEIEYNYDESEICCRIIDSGLRLRALADAVVHHKFLPSHMRAAVGFTDPFLPIKNRVYFALRVGRGYRSEYETIASLVSYIDGVKAWATDTERLRRFTELDLDLFVRRADEGFELGLRKGMEGVRRGRAIVPRDDDAFLLYPVLRPEGRRLSVGFVSIDYPPKPVGGVARYTHDLARGFAEAGHEPHVFTRDDEGPFRTDFEEGVWVHRFPVADRFVPELAGHPLKGNLDHIAAVNAAVERIADRVPIDVITGALWIAEPLLCALNPARPSVVACITPMAKVAELQPQTAAAPLTEHQIRLEQALLSSRAALEPVSHENAAVTRAIVDRPVEVIWLGVVDERARFPRTRAEDGHVQILFVGRLEPRKGVDTLLEAAVPLLREHPEVVLRLVGGDNPHANGTDNVFQDWVAVHAADVADRIVFAGAVSDQELFQAYADADVFCGPSRYESFGLVHVEAMMMGLPVVGCRVGGMLETIVDGETGALVTPGDAVRLRAALSTYVSDRTQRDQHGAAARRRYEAEFRNEVAVTRHADFFARLVDAAEAGSASQLDATEAVLADLCDLDAPRAAAAAAGLLDPTRFPLDPEAATRAALRLPDDEAFLDALFRAALDRSPDPWGRAEYIKRLNKGDSRLGIAAEVVGSPEALARGVSVEAADRLPRAFASDVQRALLTAGFAADEDDFLNEASSLLTGAETAADAWRRAGASRQELLRPMIASAPASRHVVDAETVDVEGVYSVAEIVTELEAAGQHGDEAFILTLYRLVLGRPGDPDGVGAYLQRIAQGESRVAIVGELASSAEAAQRGVPAEVADRLREGLGDDGGGGGAAAASGRRSVRIPSLRTALRPGETSVLPQVLALEGRLGQAIERSHDTTGLERWLAVLAAAQEREAVARRSEAASRASDATESARELTSANRQLGELRALLGSLVEQQAGLSANAATAAQRMADELAGLRGQIDVMARKHEAMAMDLREKLPPAEPVDALDPIVPDPDGLEARIQSIGGLRLNIGCGEKPLPDYVNVDFRELPDVDVVADAGRLPFAEGTVMEIASHHLIEHFRQHHAETVLLPYWRTLLHPNGVLRVVTPNFQVLVEHLEAGRLTFKQFKQVTFGLQDYSGDDHFALYSPETLSEVLERAGFDRVEVLEERRQNGLSPELEVVARPAG